VLLDVGRAVGENGELPDGYPITVADLERTIETQGRTAQVRRGDAVLVRTGQLTRVRRGGEELPPVRPARRRHRTRKRPA
jgi:Putative cyclase